MGEQFGTTLVTLMTGGVVGAAIGFVLAFYHGYFGYKAEKSLQEDCPHNHYVRKHDYTEVIYDSDLNNRRVVEVYKCISVYVVGRLSIKSGRRKPKQLPFILPVINAQMFILCQKLLHRIAVSLDTLF